ncbi:hypothetical protein ATPR_1046 [Acetobacter tropicalis NBRC 101654]|uniref:Uncharacterized protein n=1 Tax=Acetobacter tropicalis NBRC 101654 TaxID=749388 RepID=F7VCE6_9PROT|nr:hypothetical protein ATPR_1046 [Acetobacter tropicalis NBRC 101654]
MKNHDLFPEPEQPLAERLLKQTAFCQPAMPTDLRGQSFQAPFYAL